MQNLNKRELVVTRVFDAPIELVWKAWIDPELIMQWWGPDHFSSPSADIDFRVGGISLVCMRAPKEFGGMDMYSTWTYTKILPLELIEYIHNLADKDGNKIDPATIGMPPDFPQDMLNSIKFKNLGKGLTEMTMTQYGLPGPETEMGKNAELGLNQSLDKMVHIFKQ